MHYSLGIDLNNLSPILPMHLEILFLTTLLCYILLVIIYIGIHRPFDCIIHNIFTRNHASDQSYLSKSHGMHVVYHASVQSYYSKYHGIHVVSFAWQVTRSTFFYTIPVYNTQRNAQNNLHTSTVINLTRITLSTPIQSIPWKHVSTPQTACSTSTPWH